MAVKTLQKRKASVRSVTQNLEEDVDKVKGSASHGPSHSGSKMQLMHPKSSEPQIRSSAEEFLDWSKAGEAHCERTREKGYEDALRAARNQINPINEEGYSKLNLNPAWEDGTELYSFLRAKTQGIGRAFVHGVADDSRWKAWRLISNYYDPKVAGEEIRLEAKVTEDRKGGNELSRSHASLALHGQNREDLP